MDTTTQQHDTSGIVEQQDVPVLAEVEQQDMPVLAEAESADGIAQPEVFGIGSTAFTTYYTWLANGVHQRVNFVNSRVNANSRVYVNISEYAANPQARFIGAARMAVYNIAPYNGGFLAWVEISWGNPLKIRFDVLVDP